MSKIVQQGGFYGWFIVSLLKIGLPFMKSVPKPLAKTFLIPLGLTTAAPEADTGIHQKLLDLGQQH